MTRRIRLVHVTHGMGLGGMERVTADLVNHMARDGYEISIYCTHSRGELAETVDGACSLHVDNARSRPGHWMRPARLYRFLRRLRPQVVHTQHWGALLDTAITARAAGVPVLVHTDHSKLYPVPIRHRLLERYLSGLCDAYCAVSEHTKRDLVKHVGVPEQRVRVVANGFDFDDLPTEDDRLDVRRSLGIDAKSAVIGTVARLDPQKSQELMIHAMPRVLDEVPDVHMVLVGTGSRDEEFKQLAQTLGVANRIHFAGFRRDPGRYLAAMDLFVLSSLYEGMPIAVLEAMACGRPTLSTDVGGVPEVVLDGETGRIVRSREVSDYAEAVIDALRDRERLARWGAAARRRYQNGYRVANMVAAYDRIYRDCLERNTSR